MKVTLQPQADNSRELEAARRMANFYKSHAEQVSKENQEYMAENRRLKGAVDAQNQQVAEQTQVIQSLRR